LDGVDAVLVDFAAARLQLLGHASTALPDGLRQAFVDLNQPGPNELHKAALAANALVRIYADVVQRLLNQTNKQAWHIRAIGAHGQTVRHQPQAFDGVGYSWQLNNPALLAELTQMDVVADFRSRDLAAGGQGAPLVPAFHQFVFGRRGATVCTLNIGGFSNLCVIGPALADDVLGFDCGPGNVLMDAWCQQHLGLPFDRNGAWARTGVVQADLLQHLLAEPFFARPAPKSTGRDLFSRAWLAEKIARFPTLKPVDVQCTLAELTALTCAQSVKRYGAQSQQLLVCGGGALNAHVMQRLQAQLTFLQVCSSQTQGLGPLEVEAAAFAWLARQAITRQTASLQKVTGAKGDRVLGAIYPA
jgi:anhydro-N-acetylmuramic acid kinase